MENDDLVLESSPSTKKAKQKVGILNTRSSTYGLRLVLTEFLQISQPFIHAPPQLCPFRKLILCAGLQELFLVDKYIRLELSLLCNLGRVEYP